MRSHTHQATTAKKRWSRLERTAYHEAGHAVMCYLLHRRITIVTIVLDPEAKTLGRVQHAGMGSRALRQINEQQEHKARPRIEADILIAAAGNVAEQILTGRYNNAGSRSDDHWALEVASCIAPEMEECGAYLGWLYLRARNILLDPAHWGAVEAVAKALLTRKQLTGAQARAIIEATMGIRFLPENMSEATPEHAEG